MARNFVIGAGEGNRTLVISLEGWSSTIELHPLTGSFSPDGGRGKIRTFVDVKSADLQSAAINHSATLPMSGQSLIMHFFLAVVKRFFYTFKKKVFFHE